MRFEVLRGKTRPIIVPEVEGGIFVIDGDAFVGRLHANRAVERIRLVGSGEEAQLLRQVRQGELDANQVFENDPDTDYVGSWRAIEGIGLIALLVDGGEKSIDSFREFGPVGVVTNNT